MTIYLFNSLTRQKEQFIPLSPDKVSLYVCGPTVYDYPHIGNARSVVVYDILYRLLKHEFAEVTYVRNITDVDDKINMAAKEKKVTIQELTKNITKIFHADMHNLGCLSPTIEPKATEHIAEMIMIIERLLANNHAYIANDHVYFAIESYVDYGKLAGREIDEMIAGARIEVAEEKKHPGDFVLWKPADADDDPSSIFASPWGKGRPGWHIECSAMSSKYLGITFDIHGGGADLMFPHHTNEIAQSRCAFKDSLFARYWVHNGFLTVNGEKMSKSLGNFVTVRELLDKGVKGEVIRYLLLSSHYRKPIDFNDKALADAKKALDSFYRGIETFAELPPAAIDDNMLTALRDDLNTSEALAVIHELNKQLNKATDQQEKVKLASILKASCNFLGLLKSAPAEWFKDVADSSSIEAKVNARINAKKAKNWALADAIREELKAEGIILEDKPDGSTIWRKQ